MDLWGYGVVGLPWYFMMPERTSETLTVSISGMPNVCGEVVGG